MKLFQAFHNSSFILSFLLFACQIIVVRAQTATLGAAPAQTSSPANATTTYEVGWKSTSSRGTSDLLRSCLATIVLALWSSVVLNVQMAYGDTLNHIAQLVFNKDTRENKRKQCLLKFLGYYYFKKVWISAKAQFQSGQWVRWKHKILWAGLNVVIPELALAVALDEYDTASRLLCFLQNKKEENIDKSNQVFSTWDMSVAFYAVAGGFYVPEPEPAPEGYYIPGTKSVPQGLVERCCEVTRMRMEYLAQVREARKHDPKFKFGGPDKPKRVLTAEGVVYIAKLVDNLKGCNPVPGSDIGSYCGIPHCSCKEDGERLQAQFGDISPQILADLSKGDWLARILFMFQALWIIAQSLVRWRSDLSLTLLELQAAAHVGLATVRYFVWYHKPIDIVLMTPLSLTEAQYKRILDDSSSTRGITGHFQFEENLIRKIKGDESSGGLNGLESNTLAGNQTERIMEIPKEGMTDGRSTVDENMRDLESNTLAGNQTEGIMEIPNEGMTDGQITVDENMRDLESNTLAVNQTKRIMETPKEGMGIGQTEQTMADKIIQGWKGLLWNFADIHCGYLPYFTSQATLGKNVYQQLCGGLPFFRRPFQTVLYGTVAFTLSCHGGWWLFKVYLWAIICTVYNGINLLAWRWYFPSNFEKIAWRVCATLICANFLTLTISPILWGHFYYFVSTRVFKDPPRVFYRVTIRIGDILFWIMILPWMVAKVFIFIESLISLRKLPAKVYEEASWTSFLPHL